MTQIYFASDHQTHRMGKERARQHIDGHLGCPSNAVHRWLSLNVDILAYSTALFDLYPSPSTLPSTHHAVGLLVPEPTSYLTRFLLTCTNCAAARQPNTSGRRTPVAHQLWVPRRFAPTFQIPTCQIKSYAAVWKHIVTGCGPQSYKFGWLGGEAQPQTLAVSSPLKSLCLPLSLRLRLFLALPEMREDPPLWQWQAQVGDAIARGGNIDKNHKGCTKQSNRKEEKRRS